MKAAMPSGLKLESEATYALAEEDEFDETTLEDESQTAKMLIQALKKKPQTLDQLRKNLPPRNLVATLRQLTERGLVEVVEKVSQGFKARTETHVRLAEDYQSEAALHLLLDLLGILF